MVSSGGVIIRYPDLKIGAIQLYFTNSIIFNSPDLQLGETYSPKTNRALAHFILNNRHRIKSSDAYSERIIEYLGFSR